MGSSGQRRPGFFPAPKSYHRGSRCHSIALVATPVPPSFATLRFPVLIPPLQPLAHTSPQEKHRGIVVLSGSLYIQDIKDKNSFSSLLFPLLFMLLYALIYLNTAYDMTVHKEAQIN